MEIIKELFYILNDVIDKNFGDNKYSKEFGKGIFIQKYTWKHNRDKADEKIFGDIIQIAGQYYSFDGEKSNIEGFYTINTSGHYPSIDEGEIKIEKITGEYDVLGKFPTNAIIFKFIDKNVGLWNKGKYNIPYVEEYLREYNTNLEELEEIDADGLKKIAIFLKEIKNNLKG